MRLFILVCLLSLAVDQAAKLCISSHMQVGESVAVIPHFFSLTYAENPGGAFRILAYQTPLFIALGLLMVTGVVVVLLYWPRRDPRLMISLGLLTGGVLGNLIDRLRTGYVTDFFDFHVWPVFNFADVFILVGAVFLFYLLVIPKGKQAGGR